MRFSLKKYWKKLPITIRAAYIGGAFIIASVIIAWFLNSPSQSPQKTSSPTVSINDLERNSQPRRLSFDPNTGRTPIYDRTRVRVEKRSESLIKEKIDPWLLMRGSKTTITLHNGRTYGFYGLEYSGSVVIVFWEGLIEPFLEDAIQEIFDEVGAECVENRIDACVPLEEAAMFLRGMVCRIYQRMVYVDQKLRTKRGVGKLPPPRDVQHKIDRVTLFVNEQLKAATALYSRHGLKQE